MYSRLCKCHEILLQEKLIGSTYNEVNGFYWHTIKQKKDVIGENINGLKAREITIKKQTVSTLPEILMVNISK